MQSFLLLYFPDFLLFGVCQSKKYQQKRDTNIIHGNIVVFLPCKYGMAGLYDCGFIVFVASYSHNITHFAVDNDSFQMFLMNKNTVIILFFFQLFQSTKHDKTEITNNELSHQK